MPVALPHQLQGASFLSRRRTALLADEPRVGKTGAAILGADDAGALRVCVVTTASGRPVWARGFADWSLFPRRTAVFYGGALTEEHLKADLLVIGWAAVDKLLAAKPERYDLLLLDESHYAKSAEAKRTAATYGSFRGQSRGWGLCDLAERVWCLTGTPLPNAPNDAWPMLRALAPERLTTEFGPCDVTAYQTFLHRYCVVRTKHISRYTKVDVVVGGRNLDELKARLDGFWLRRTQKDVGITTPIYELLPIHITAAQRKAIEAEVEDAAEILDAAETGETKALDMHLGPLRRLTGTIKAAGVAQAVKDEMESGLDKVVVMAWHRDVLNALEDELSRFGCVRVDGGTSPTARDKAMQDFQGDPAVRVFLGQIVACGEAIDLSAAAELIFAESSSVPKDMKQAALRITNHGQQRQPRVRVAALEGSIDEALQAILVRKVEAIKGVQG